MIFVPEFNNVAGMRANAAFLAPEILTEPDSLRPPCMMSLSIFYFNAAKRELFTPMGGTQKYNNHGLSTNQESTSPSRQNFIFLQPRVFERDYNH